MASYEFVLSPTSPSRSTSPTGGDGGFWGEGAGGGKLGAGVADAGDDEG